MLTIVRLTLAVTIALTGLAAGAMDSSKRMPDGKEWMTANLNVDVPGSYCYEDVAANCDRYGRLYTWDAARRACPSLGAGWRLPTEDEWRQLASQYGGVHAESDESGKAAYAALVSGGSSGFNAVFGGNREKEGGSYDRLEHHALYWTATETAPGTAWIYNFGIGAKFLNRHRGGDKRMAASVRCLKD